MDWKKIYKPERKIDWRDVCDLIRESVTIGDALTVYAPGTPRKHHRCPCPIHNGKDYNFSYTQNGYICFVCGASGDVISLVKEVCELSTRQEAMRKICEDFHLGVYFDAPCLAETREKVNRAREEANRRRAERDAWWDKYHDLMDKLIEYQKTLENGDPESPEYAVAARNIATIEYQLDSLPQEPR